MFTFMTVPASVIALYQAWHIKTFNGGFDQINDEKNKDGNREV
jgi:hypothetical protein